MSKLYAVTLILTLSFPATSYAQQVVLKLKAREVVRRLEKLGENVSVSICEDGKGYVEEFTMYGKAHGDGRRTVYGEMKEALDALIPQKSRGRLLSFGGGRVPPSGCCDSFRYGYERVGIEEVLMHGRYYEIKVWMKGERPSNKTAEE